MRKSGRLKKILLGIVLGTGILILMLPVCLIVAWKSWYLFAAHEEQQQLSLLDQQFAVPRSLVPTSITDNGLLPSQVASFRRSDEILRGGCDSDSCIHAFYRTEQGQYLSLNISINDWGTSTKAALALQNMLNQPGRCGPEGGGESNLRATSANGYFYLSCGYYVSPESLVAVAWTNGQWLIMISGNYDSMSQFLRDYPY